MVDKATGLLNIKFCLYTVHVHWYVFIIVGNITALWHRFMFFAVAMHNCQVFFLVQNVYNVPPPLPPQTTKAPKLLIFFSLLWCRMYPILLLFQYPLKEVVVIHPEEEVLKNVTALEKYIVEVGDVWKKYLIDYIMLQNCFRNWIHFVQFPTLNFWILNRKL